MNKDEVEELNKKLKKRIIDILVKADVSNLVFELLLYQDDDMSDWMGGYPIDNAYGEELEEGELEKLKEEQEIAEQEGRYIDSHRLQIEIDGIKHDHKRKKVNSWYVVDEHFTPWLQNKGEVVVLDMNLWGVTENIDEIEESKVLQSFFDESKLLYGEENSIFPIEEE